MSLFRWISRSVPAAFGVVALSAGTAAADQPLFTWTGTVDREVLIVMRGRTIDERGADSQLRSSTRVLNSLPRTTGDVQVRVENGRGRVQVIEQPTSRNNYQTVVRITDPQGGSDRYRLVATWVGDDRYDNRGNNGGYGNGRRDDDRDDDRNRVRDRRDRDRDDRNNNGRGEGWGYGRDDDRDRNGNRGRDDDRYGNDRNLGAGSLRWSGRVDDVVDITISGRNVDYRTRSGANTVDVRSSVSGGGLPRRDGTVTIVGGSGRGSVQVVQQPTARNGYTAIIRVSDQRAGAGQYDFEARWY